MVFITPESIIKKGKYRDMLMSAHCVKTWGDEFRVAFSQIGDLKSILPATVGVHALTATATTETYNVVCKRLAMENVELIALPPNRDNICYLVKPNTDANTLTNIIADELKKQRTSYPKTLIYVRTYKDCCTLYLMLKKKLGREIMEPPGCPNVAGHRLVETFTTVLTAEKKDEIIRSFTCTNGSLRLIIATTTFGMGIDCPDIHQIFHWGIPSSVEEYVQETGRSGRDGLSSRAILYKGKRFKKASKKMKSYVTNKSKCRRRLLFQEFLMYHEDTIKASGTDCCDICGKIEC